HVAPYTTAQFPEDNHFGAEVKVTLRGGSTLTGKVDQPAGRTSDNPLSRDELKAKFDNCAARVLPAARVRALYETIDAFEALADVRAVSAAMTEAAASKPASGKVRA
ncbi:MAG TPA: hypothetical protein VNT02_11810, partial [Burkholderiales bacterium]|nr:hypothetical protein [Burkholderiales bacterium]